jgi:hypothetical protein
LVAILVLCGQASGVVQLITTDDCARRCDKASASHDRDQDCQMCPFCHPTRMAMLAGHPTVHVMPGDSLTVEAALLPHSPDPSDISHIPKPSA